MLCPGLWLDWEGDLMLGPWTVEQADVLLRVVEVKMPGLLASMVDASKRAGLWPEDTEEEPANEI